MPHCKTLINIKHHKVVKKIAFKVLNTNSLVAQMVKSLPAKWETQIRSLDR